MNIRYRVHLDDEERTHLQALTTKGTSGVRRLKRAQILLAADRGEPDAAIAASVNAGLATVGRVKRRCVLAGVEAALAEEPRPGALRKLSGADEALLIATACTAPPAGRSRWTLALLAGRMVELTGHEGLSRETVRRRLHAQDVKPWQHKMWCIPTLSAAYVARMEDLLALYAEPSDPKYPVVCFDETPVQLVAEVAAPIPPAPGRPTRVDYEYARTGSANLFVCFDPARRWRHVTVTERRGGADFAAQMQALVDVHYPEATTIRVVLDNLSTHSETALYAGLPAPEARRILDRLEFHYTPKHASWLNQVEIEIGALKTQCLARRIATREALARELAACVAARNRARIGIDWRFTCERARTKMPHAYPAIPNPTAKAA